MLVVRLHKPPSAKKLEGVIEKAADLPAGTIFVLTRKSEHEWHLEANKPLKRVTAKLREQTRALFEGESDGEQT